MAKTSKNTRDHILNCAWKLFYRQGYNDTTIDDILDSANISKGTFYHYFDNKEALVYGMSYMLDSKYEEILAEFDDTLNPLDKLVKLTQEISFMMENTIPVYLMTRNMAAQLTLKGDKHMLDPDRTYYKVVRKIVIDGKEQGVFKDHYSVNEIVVSYALLERGLMYDWCISNGNYALSQYSTKIMRVFLTGFTV
jgi:AcrR family transcriptional regulator